MPRTDEAGGLYQALNRGNAREVIFRKVADYEASERILAEGRTKYSVKATPTNAGSSSFPIQADEHFLTFCRYVALNALHARWVRQTGKWRWGNGCSNQKPIQVYFRNGPFPAAAMGRTRE